MTEKRTDDGAEDMPRFVTPSGKGVQIDAARRVAKKLPPGAIDPLLLRMERAYGMEAATLKGYAVTQVATIYGVSERYVYEELKFLREIRDRGRPGLLEDGSYGYGPDVEA